MTTAQLLAMYRAGLRRSTPNKVRAPRKQRDVRMTVRTDDEVGAPSVPHFLLSDREWNGARM